MDCMATRIALRCLATLAALLATACSDAPKSTPEKPPAKAPEALTGRQAFQRMYPQARVWAADAQPLQLRSINLKDVKSEGGKAGAWQVVFVSMSLAKSKTYTYSAIEGENLHEGVFGAVEESWSGTTGQTAPFPVAAIKTDSDQAYDVAVKNSKEYLKKNPTKPFFFLLEQNKRFPDLTWRVIWGDSVGTSDYSIFVDASLGTFLERMH